MTSACKTPQPISKLLEPGYHPIYARVLCTIATEQGVDIAQLLSAAEMTDADIATSAIRVSHTQMNALINTVRSVCENPRIAFEWGARVGNTAHGIAGVAFLSSNNVRQAISVFCSVLALRTTTLHAQVVEHDSYYWLELSEALPMLETRNFLFAGVAVMTSRLIEVILGREFAQVNIELPLSKTQWGAACEEYFSVSPTFNAAKLRFGVPVTLLDRPCPTADPGVHATAMDQCALDTMNLSASLTTRIGAYLAQLPGKFPPLETAARHFCLSSRTFSRALNLEGTRYQTLLDNARRDLAQRLLRQTDLSVDEIAERLGYADTSNFIRAFRRWCQRTPQHYRSEYQIAPAAIRVRQTTLK